MRLAELSAALSDLAGDILRTTTEPWQVMARWSEAPADVVGLELDLRGVGAWELLSALGSVTGTRPARGLPRCWR